MARNKDNPWISLECTEQLLRELHEAHNAGQRSRARARKSTAFSHLESLLVQIAAARLKAANQLQLALSASDSESAERSR